MNQTLVAILTQMALNAITQVLILMLFINYAKNIGRKE
jgi:hypothetical protein